MDAAAVGNKPFAGDTNFNDMKKILEGFDSATTNQKQTLNETSAVTMSADTPQQVGELMALMRNAGMDPKVMPGNDMKVDPMPNAKMDDPKIPGKDDVVGDIDLKAGALGKLAGGAVGALGSASGASAAAPIGAAIGNMIAPGIGGAAGGAIGSALGAAAPVVAGAELVGGESVEEDGANEELNSIRKNAGLNVQEAGEDTATSVAQELKKMGVSADAHEDKIIKMIPDALKSLGLEGVLRQMNMSKGYQHDMLSDILDAVRSMGEAVVGGNAKPEDPDSVYARLMSDISEIQNGAMDDNDMADDISDELGDYLRNGDAPEDSHYAKAVGIVMDAIHDGPQAQAEAAEEAISFLHSAEEEARGNNEDYANEPDEDYAPYTDMVKGGDDIGKSKKSYKPVAGGDNPMALEASIKEQLWAALNEKMATEGRGRGKTLKASRGEKLNASRGSKLMASRGRGKKK